MHLVHKNHPCRVINGQLECASSPKSHLDIGSGRNYEKVIEETWVYFLFQAREFPVRQEGKREGLIEILMAQIWSVVFASLLEIE